MIAEAVVTATQQPEAVSALPNATDIRLIDCDIHHKTLKAS